MPPCGYRSNAVEGVKMFLSDNLLYFVELGRGRGARVHEAILQEEVEIGHIRDEGRGGAWSAAAVGLNALFYKRLLAAHPQSWDDVEAVGTELIAEMEADLSSLMTIPTRGGSPAFT